MLYRIVFLLDVVISLHDWLLSLKGNLMNSSCLCHGQPLSWLNTPFRNPDEPFAQVFISICPWVGEFRSSIQNLAVQADINRCGIR